MSIRRARVATIADNPVNITGPNIPQGPTPDGQTKHERQILRLLARGEREIAAAKGYDLDVVLTEADHLFADA